MLNEDIDWKCMLKDNRCVIFLEVEIVKIQIFLKVVDMFFKYFNLRFFDFRILEKQSYIFVSYLIYIFYYVQQYQEIYMILES